MKRNLYTIAAFTLLLAFAIPVMAMACETPTCPPGEMWGQTGEHCYQVPAVYGPCQNCPYIEGQYGPWGNWQCGKCSHDDEDDGICEDRDKQSCPHPDHQERRYRTYTPGYYQCHGEEYVSCDGAHHEKRITASAHEQCDPVFGCVAVSCPAIPCEEDFECVGNTCQPIPPAVVEQTTGFYAFTAGPCSAPARVVNLSEKDGRTYMVRASYMGFIDNLTISTYYEAGDSDTPYWQVNPFVTSTSGVGIVSLSSGGAVARSFEYAAIKDETSTPDGWQTRGELVDMSTGAIVDTQSTEGSDTCLHVLYNFSLSS